LLAIKDNQRWSKARADQVVDADAKAKVAVVPERKKDRPSLG
jgi:hypothetical protein